MPESGSWSRSRSRILIKRQDPAPFSSTAGSGSFLTVLLNPLGATALEAASRTLLLGPNPSRTIKVGYYSDYPVAGKVAGKPMYLGLRHRFRGSSRTLGTRFLTSGKNGLRPLLLAP